MGRLAATCTAVALVALAACAVAAAGRGDPKHAIAKADQARATSMLLRMSDLAAGFTAGPAGKDTDFYCRAIDESDLTVTADARSPQFTLQATGRLFALGSEAQIYRTASQALTSWRRSTSPAGERCAQKLLAQAFTGSPLRFRSFARQSFPPVAPLTIAYRVTADLTVSGTTVTAYFDVIVLERGRAQASLQIVSLGRPLVRSESLGLARLTGARMAAAMRGG